MGFIKRKIQEIKDTFSKDKQLMNNGNKFDVYTKMEVQEKLDLQSMKDYSNYASDIVNIDNVIQSIADFIVNEKNIEPYFLLQYQANYFCGTCKFECEDLVQKNNIIQIIRGAFLMGCAGLYKEDNIYQPVSITQLEYDIAGEVNSCKILPLGLSLQKMNEFKASINPDTLKGWRTLNKEQCKNLAIFQWGTMGYSAWINIWPFVKLQHNMLTMIIIHSYVFNKKWIYNLKNIATMKKEIELFFNPANPFIINLGNMGDLPNRFSTEDIAKTSQGQDLLDYYNKTIAAYYHILGRQINLDVKKERNVSNEVEASQENFDIVQSDWLNQFDMFIQKCKELGINCKSCYEIQQEEKEQEKELMENANQGNKDRDN